MSKKLYAKRDAEGLGAHYLRHIAALTAEGLHDKCDIAAELAFRDMQLEEASQWQPIDTAPKDGTLVVVYDGDPGCPIEMARYFEDNSGWFDDAHGFRLKPTYWQPLPEPPQEGGAQ